jgi:hypothetical protein
MDEATTTDHPEGDAANAWKNLLNKHEPNTSANKVQVKGKYQQSRLSNVKYDPESGLHTLEDEARSASHGRHYDRRRLDYSYHY